jgi:5-methylcytosine-specific restriction endonuclease McrA
MKRKKLPAISTMRNKCDNLLTPIIKLTHPHCLLCGAPTEVAHHHVHKSSSNRLRYEIINLINLCNSCHCALHNNESYYASKVVMQKGLAWFEEIERLKRQTVKPDVHWYIGNYESLKSYLSALQQTY